MANLPTDVAAQALDAIGSERTIGDIEDGSREAEVILRAYLECLRQLLRGAHWNFARRQAPLTLLADATGQSADAGSAVIQPWTYEYALPIDCVKARFVPWNYSNLSAGVPPGNIQIPTTVPLTTGSAPPMNQMRIVPARFLVASDFNYIPAGTGYETPTLSPTARMVVVTNVKCAQLVYTAMMEYPSMWDPMFRAALVAWLAGEIALPILKDKRFALEMRERNYAIAKEKIREARIRDGDEGWANSDIEVDWMRVRNSGSAGAWGNGWGAGGGPGVLGYGWDACSFTGNTGAY